MTYTFDAFRLYGKVEPIAKSVCRGYNIPHEWEDVAQSVHIDLMTRANALRESVKSASEEKTVIKWSAYTACQKILKKDPSNSDWYTYDWVFKNLNSLIAGPSIPTYDFIRDPRIGIEARMVTTHQLSPHEYADFDEAFDSLTDRQRDVILGDDKSDTARGLRSKAIDRLKVKMNNIAKERGKFHD